MGCRYDYARAVLRMALEKSGARPFRFGVQRSAVAIHGADARQLVAGAAGASVNLRPLKT